MAPVNLVKQVRRSRLHDTLPPDGIDRVDCRDAESQKLLEELNDFAWRHVARRFHPPTKQWAGPHSRAYSTLLRTSTLAFIQRAANDAIHFLPTPDAWESTDAYRIGAECPKDLLPFFTDLPGPREEIEAFQKNPAGEHDIIGTTYLHPDFTLGSVNIGDLWNQRRPLLAYWNTRDGVGALRLRCLRDNYDYSCASLFTVQDQGDILGAVIFATDRGDTHISLDRIKDATIKAEDLRLRLQFEGAVGDLALPAAETGAPIHFYSGPVAGTFHLPWAEFADAPLAMETGRDSAGAWIDLVFYHGSEREIDFRKVKAAGAIFALSMTARGDSSPETTSMASLRITDGRSGNDVPVPERRAVVWERSDKPLLSLSISVAPLGTSGQRRECSARLGSTNPWKTTNR